MAEVLRRHGGGWLSRDELAHIIAAENLYARRDGQPAPSDQLRLRARKYPHLFECSDTACTRIRLRPNRLPTPSPGPTGRNLRSARRSTPHARKAAMLDAEGARRRRASAARKYRPEQIQLLLVAEAPPSALDRYFYFEDVREQDALFRYVARAILGAEPTRGDKPKLLKDLRTRGVFLIDLSLDPVDGTPLADEVPGLLRRLKRLKPEKVILIKASVYDAAFRRMAEAGLPVIDERIPFPGSGQQRRFEAAFARALKKRPKSA